MATNQQGLNMSVGNPNVLTSTPDIAELMPVRKYACELGCDEVYSNQSHYFLHLRQRHKGLNLPAKRTDPASRFHCPVERCIYHIQQPVARSFTTLRLLRQHYQKIHLEKNYKCDKCNQKFLLEHHLTKHECKEFKCPVCELIYNSKAGLRTHMRRKNHIAEENSEQQQALPKVLIPSLKAFNQQKHVATTSEPCVDVAPTEAKISISTQPEMLLYCLPIVEIQNEMQTQPPIVTTETATEMSNKQPEADTNDNYIPSITAEEVDLLLHDMETQTDDVDLDAIDMNTEVLAPLLRDIETQTLDNMHHQGTMTEEQMETTATGVDYYEEPMFGPQNLTHMHTQTCDELFEELGLSHIQTQTNWPDGLYNTQCTQTCDEMWDDILETFQSTAYTQTKWIDWQDTEDAAG